MKEYEPVLCECCGQPLPNRQRRVVRISRVERDEWEHLTEKSVFWLVRGFVGFFVAMLLLIAIATFFLSNQANTIRYLLPIALIFLLGILFLLRIKTLKDEVFKKKKEMEEKYGVDSKEEYCFR